MARGAKATGRSWLVKSEPGTYSWQQLVKDGRTRWDGVRNFEARNHLRAMKAGDVLLFYHTGDDKQIVGLARVARVAYPDPTAKDGDWSAVDIEPVKPLKAPVTLSAMKADTVFEQFALLRRSRLSVVPVEPLELARILKLGKTALGTR
jgi:predicted RNA-binding protein with PUA-like domain